MKCKFPFAKESGSIGPDTPEEVTPPVARGALHARGLMLAGLSDAGRGYFMHRPRPPYHHLLVTMGGRGRVWVDGKWVECGKGLAYVSPALHPCAFETFPRGRWQFAWVFLYDTGAPSPGALSAGASTLIPAEPKPLATAIEGLYREGVGHGDKGLLDHWAHLIHVYALRLAQAHPSHRIDQLGWLWSDVDARPAANWSLASLADRAGMSRETLRKICIAHHGRSPMEHVTHLRMRRAETLLQSSSAKLAVIARLVGYENVFAFSTAFRRVYGVPPSARRQRSLKGGDREMGRIRSASRSSSVTAADLRKSSPRSTS